MRSLRSSNGAAHSGNCRREAVFGRPGGEILDDRPRRLRTIVAFDILASIAWYAIIMYAIFAAVTQLGIAVELTAPTFLIVLGAVALVAALAFGIGGRKVARDILKKAYNRR